MAKQEKNQQAQTEHSQAGAVIEMLTERGYLGNQEINDAKLRDALPGKAEGGLSQHLMLLKQYRNIAWMLECFPDTIAEELEQPFTNLDELIDRVDVEMAMDNRKLEWAHGEHHEIAAFDGPGQRAADRTSEKAGQWREDVQADSSGLYRPRAAHAE